MVASVLSVHRKKLYRFSHRKCTLLRSNHIKLIKSVFFRNGYHCPTAYNPADFLISVLSKTELGEELNNVAHRLCDAFNASRTEQLARTANNFVIEEDKKVEIQKPLWIFTIYWLINRNLLIVARDPSIQKIRIVQKIVSESKKKFFFQNSK